MSFDPPPGAAPPGLLLATCETYPELTESGLMLVGALRERDVPVQAVPWEFIDAAAPNPALVCLFTTWNYHLKSPEFRRWIAGFQAHPGALLNPPETVLWNMDKGYLRELIEAGIRVPDTVWLEPGERLDVATAMAGRGWDRAVLKPRISGGAYGTWLLSGAGENPSIDWDLLRESGGLLQRFVPQIQSRGEISLIFLDGSYSHAVCKRPMAGDFRVQAAFGGAYSRLQPPTALIDFGHATLEASGMPWVYARVDVVETPDGPTLMELELIEPELFFHHAPEAAEEFAMALIRRLAPE